MTLTQRHPNAQELVAKAIDKGLMAYPKAGDAVAAYRAEMLRNYRRGITKTGKHWKKSPQTPLLKTEADAEADAGVKFVKHCQ